MQLRFLAKSNAVLVHVHFEKNFPNCVVFFFYQIKHFEKKFKVRYEGT